MRNALSRLAVLALAAALCAPALAERGEGGEDHERHERGERHEGRGLLPVAANPTWTTECGACHVAYPPGLLPERSWRAVMDGLDRHFGADASLDAATRKTITEFLAANAANRVARFLNQ